MHLHERRGPRRSLPGRRVAAGVVVAALAIGLAACAPTANDEATTSLVIADALPTSFYPTEITAGNLVIQGVYDTVLTGDPFGPEGVESIRPGLASEWEFSDDGREITLKIREGVTFSDGEPVTAYGIAKVLNTWLDDPAGVFVSQATSIGTEIEAIDEYTLVSRSDKPYDPGVGMGIPISSPTALDDRESLTQAPVGSGPYLLDEAASVPGVEMHLVRNEDYWDIDSYPYDEITVMAFDDPIAAHNALQAGQVDATAIDLAAAAEAEEAGFELSDGHAMYWTLFFGDRAGRVQPAIADVRVRQAINLAFDRETIAETIDLGLGRVTSQIFGPNQRSYLDGEDDRYAYDLDRARDLMAEAGYADGFDLTIPSSSYTAAMEPIVLQSLADIGIRVTYETFPDIAAHIEAIWTGDYPVMLILDYFVSVRFNYLNEGGQFVMPWDNADPTVTALLERIDTGTVDDQLAASQELGRYLLDEAWFAPFSAPPTVWAHRTDVDLPLPEMVAYPRLRDFSPAE